MERELALRRCYGDRCLESLKRVVCWRRFFLLVDVLLEYSHLTQHFDLDISEMLNRLERKCSDIYLNATQCLKLILNDMDL